MEQFSLQKLTQFWKGFFIKEGGQSEVSVQKGRRKKRGACPITPLNQRP